MHILITGGAGFIGTNTALYFAGKGNQITILDDLSRPGVGHNLHILLQHSSISHIKASVLDIDSYRDVLQAVDCIIHLAGQTAVTTSLRDPIHDFEVNVLGTFRLLEAVRKYNPRATVLYASTNKVYGNLTSHTLHVGIMYLFQMESMNINNSTSYHHMVYQKVPQINTSRIGHIVLICVP